MAQIVCIDTGTLNTKINAIDDIVAIHDDDVELTGTGYALLTVYKVENVTAAEVGAKLNSLMPEQKLAWKLEVGGKFTHERPEEIQTWKNSLGKWCKLVENPKYQLSMVSLTTQDKEALASKVVMGTQTLSILGKCAEKIHLNEINNLEIVALNEVIK